MTRLSRRYLILALNSASGKSFYTLYQYVSNPRDLRRIIPRAIENARLLVPDKFESQVVRALAELERLAERLEGELAEPSRFFIELAENTIKSVASGDDIVLKKFIADHLVEFNRLFPLDVTTIDEKNRVSVVLFNPRKSDVSRVIYLLKLIDPYKAIYGLVGTAFSDSTLKETIYKIVDGAVRVGLSSNEVVVGGYSIRLSPNEMTRVLIALGRSNELREHLNRLYGGLLEKLSEQLGVNVELVDVNITSQSYQNAEARLMIRNIGKVVGARTGSEYHALVSIGLIDATPMAIRVYYKHGDFLVAASQRDCVREECFARIIDELKSDAFRNGLEALDHAVSNITRLGYRIEKLYRERDGHVVIHAVRNDVVLEYKYDLRTRHGEAALHVPCSQYAPTTFYRAGDVEITVSNKKLSAYADNITPLDIVRLEELAVNELSKLTEKWRKTYDNISKVDAVIIYMMYKYRAVSDSEINSRVGVNPRLIFLKASRALGNSFPLPTKLLVESTRYLYESGVLTINDDGYLCVFGKRIVDVSTRYFGSSVYGEIAEKRILDSLLSNYSNMELFEGKRVPSRLIRMLADEALNPIAMKHAVEHLSNIAGNKQVWESLPQHEKILIIATCGDTLIEKAKKNNWQWILDDTATRMIALTSKLNNPSEITKFLAENFPDALGNDYELVDINGEYFIKHGRAYLQVRKVLFNGFLFQGTLVGSKAGMFLKARTVNEASRIIQDSIMDHVLDFKELVSELRAKGYSVSVGKYENPLFSIPYITVTIGARQVTIPLQVNFRDRVEKIILEKTQNESREPLEEFA